MNGGIAQLRQDHDIIEVLAKRLGCMVETDTAPDVLSTTLGHLLTAVADHLAREDTSIYTLALSAQPGLPRDSARRARDDFERLKLDWRDYLVFWTPEAIAADRPGFVAATRAMLPRLRNRVKLEESLLTASALQIEQHLRRAV